MNIVMCTLQKYREQAEASAHRALENCGIDNVRVIIAENMEGEGYVKGMNKALSQVPEGEYFVCLNDDSFPETDNWLDIMLAEMEKRAMMKVWFAGPSGGCRTPPQSNGRIGDKRRPKLVKHVAGFCMLCHPNVLEKVGLMDNTFLHYAGEIDWQWRATKHHGAKALWIPSVFVQHQVHEPHHDWWQRDHSLLTQKWR